MAWMLSRIATFALVFATLLVTAFALRASAEDHMRVSTAATSVDNPFVAKSLKKPTAIQTVSGPHSFQNPFAQRATATHPSSAAGPNGAMNRWRRPGVATQASVSNDADAALPQPAWDVLSPVELGRQLGRGMPVASGGTFGAIPPPDSVQYEPQLLRQPDWLAADGEASTDEPGHLDHTPRPNSAAVTTQAASPDPFEATPYGGQKASAIDDDATVYIEQIGPSVAGSPIDRLDVAESWAMAQDVAAQAQSLDEFSRVIDLCRHGLNSGPARGEATSMRSLAAWAANRCGELQSEGGREDDALKSFEEALELDPYCWLALHNRAVSRAQQGQIDTALDDFNRALTLNPGLAVAYRNRGELLASLGRTNDAIADYGRAIDQLPQDAGLHMMRGHALHRLGKYPQALDDLNRAIELAAENFEAYTHRGNILAELGDYKQAVRDFHQALRLNPESADAYRSIAWLLATCPDERFRNPQKALNAAEQASKLSAPGDPFILEAQAAAYACAGEFDQAVQFQQEAVSIAPSGFVDQFASRLALYQENKPFRNAIHGRTRQSDVREASLESAAR